VIAIGISRMTTTVCLNKVPTTESGREHLMKLGFQYPRKKGKKKERLVKVCFRVPLHGKFSIDSILTFEDFSLGISRQGLYYGIGHADLLQNLHAIQLTTRNHFSADI